MSLPTVTDSTFYVSLDAATTTVAVPYTASGGSLTVASAASFGSPSSSHPLRITAQQVSTGTRTHYSCESITGNVLTVTPIDGYSDLNLSVGDYVTQADSAEEITDLQTAILASQAVINEHASLAAPIASPSFTGTVTIGTLTGLLKASTGVVSTATAGTDYLAPTGNGSGLTGLTGSQITGNIAGNAASITGSISGSQVTGLVAELATLATLASPSFTGTITLGTLSGVLKGTAGAVSAATAGTDYVSPSVATAFTGQQNFGLATLTYAGSIAWNLATQQVAEVTLTGNATLANPTSMVAGGTYLAFIKQDGTGSRTLAYGTDYDFGASGAPTLTTTAGALDIITFVSDGSKMYGAFKGGF